MNLELTKEEQDHVRAALRFLRIRFGTWASLAKVLKLAGKTMENMTHGRGPQAISERVAFRVARLAGVGIDDVLVGKFPPPGTCPFCGHTKEET